MLHCMSPELCRFSDAGDDDLAARCGGRRPKSAKARNRGNGWYGVSAAGYGELATSSGARVMNEAAGDRFCLVAWGWFGA